MIENSPQNRRKRRSDKEVSSNLAFFIYFTWKVFPSCYHVNLERIIHRYNISYSAKIKSLNFDSAFFQTLIWQKTTTNEDYWIYCFIFSAD